MLILNYLYLIQKALKTVFIQHLHLNYQKLLVYLKSFLYNHLTSTMSNNNRDFITIVKVKTWDDVLNFNQKANELFMEHWDTKERRKSYNDAYDKYFTE